MLPGQQEGGAAADAVGERISRKAPTPPSRISDR
jgi:hypothetical protein